MFKMHLHGNHLLIFSQSKPKDFQACFQNPVTNQRQYSCCIMFVIAHNKTTSIFSLLFIYYWVVVIAVQLLSHVWLFDPMDCSTPGSPVLHYLLEFAQVPVHWVSDAIQPSHPLSSPSPSGFSLSQHQGLFQWIGSSHQVAKILELQLQQQSFQWIFRVDFF